MAENNYGETALHITLHCGYYKDISEKLWFWAREVHLNVSDDLLARDNNGQTACCINIEAKDEFEGFFSRMYIVRYKDTIKLKGNLLVARYKCGQSARHPTIQSAKREVFKLL